MRAMAVQGGISLLLLGTILAFSSCSKKQATQEGKGKNKGPLEVNVVIISKSSLEDNITVNGSLLANEQVELRAESQGKIVSLNLQEGTTVRKGELLAKLNDADLQATLKRQKAQEKQLSIEENRKKELLAIHGISQQEYEQAKTSLDAIRADMQMTLAQIEKTEIRAPFNGTVGLRSVSLGAFVNQTTTIANLIQTTPLKVEFNLPERYITALKKGDSIPFIVEGDNTDYAAKIYAVEPEVDQLSRTIKVRAYAANTKAHLIPGIFVKVKVPLKAGTTMLAPAEAIVPQLGSQNVYLIKNGKAKLTQVTTGYRTGTQVEIVKGVSLGDTLVTTGLLMIKEDMPVKVASIQ